MHYTISASPCTFSRPTFLGPSISFLQIPSGSFLFPSPHSFIPRTLLSSHSLHLFPLPFLILLSSLIFLHPHVVLYMSLFFPFPAILPSTRLYSSYPPSTHIYLRTPFTSLLFPSSHSSRPSFSVTSVSFLISLFSSFLSPFTSSCYFTFLPPLSSSLPHTPLVSHIPSPAHRF